MPCDIAYIWITRDKEALTAEAGEDGCPLPCVQYQDSKHFYLTKLILTAKRATPRHRTFILVDKQSMTNGQYQCLEELLSPTNVKIVDLREHLSKKDPEIYKKYTELFEYFNDQKATAESDKLDSIFSNIIDLPRIPLYQHGLDTGNNILGSDFDVEIRFPIDNEFEDFSLRSIKFIGNDQAIVSAILSNCTDLEKTNKYWDNVKNNLKDEDLQNKEGHVKEAISQRARSVLLDGFKLFDDKKMFLTLSHFDRIDHGKLWKTPPTKNVMFFEKNSTKELMALLKSSQVYAR